MTWQLAVLVALGAAVGAPSRYLVDRSIQRRYDPQLPWGTFVVNVVGSLVLGVLLALPISPEVVATVGTGFCGALTTYSALSWESYALARSGRRAAAAWFLALSVVVGVAVAALGWAVVRLLTTG